MTRSIRWRIVVLQTVALLVFIFGSGAAFFASNFTNNQIHDQLAPQQIYFPANAQAGLPKDLSQYAGQQVLTGEQAHAYADKYIGLHLSEIGQDHPYSYWSAQAMKATDPAEKAKDQGIADTLFKGETLRGMLNQAWTFSVIAQIAFYAGIAFALAALVVLGTLIFEAIEMRTGRDDLETLHLPRAHIEEPELAGVR
ncbi:MAG TPA: hypothetical protein VFW76_07730 [Ktedonobacterales bacterium]|nr:hypothetical protein [Ktedonobacterales bacterium]